MKMLLKICGIGDAAIMHQLAQLPVDMLGFIFYARSPRYVPGKIDPSEIAKLPEHINKVGVFVNEDEAIIEKNALTYHLDTLQLHGNESPEMCKNLKSKGYRIIKTFNLTRQNDFDAYAPYCDFFLFDTPSEKHGGNGAKFDWSLLGSYKGQTPFLLSGGIGPDDAEELQQVKHPQMAGIDINSKFEDEAGVKNVNTIKNFIQTPPSPPEKSGQALKGVQRDSMHYGAIPILFEFAKNNRLNPTDAEDFLWKQISGNKLGVRFKRQHPIAYFIADFYCHKARLIIEVDGGYHNIPSQYEYNSNRDFELEELGLKVIRFSNEEVLFDIENTIQKIKIEIKSRIPKD
jgi:phosphoribosylanthranilate isomerase